jgi:diguanylate cyclase (GGDEF)-like protein
MAGSLVELGWTQLDTGQYAEALSLLLEALLILDQAENPVLRARCYGGISWVYFSNGDFSAARNYIERAIQICEVHDLKTELGQCLNSAGGILMEIQQSDEAIQVLQRSIAIFKAIGNEREEAIAHNNLGMILMGIGRLESAEVEALTGLSMIQGCNTAIRESNFIDTLGLVYQKQGKLQQAAEQFQKALDLVKKFPNSPVSVENHLHLGSIYLEMGQMGSAYLHLQQALDIAERYDVLRVIFYCHEQLSYYYERQGLFQKALEHYRQFHTFKEKIFNQDAMQRMANLSTMHKIETARKDAEILRLRNSLLVQEIEQEKQRHAELEVQAATDPLTGLFNRRHFMLMGTRHFHSARANLLPLSLIMMDVDHFKNVNDQHGHLVGDRVLIQLSEVLNSCIRQEDLCCRYGGEEFVILLPNTDLKTGLTIAERVRHEVCSLTTLTGDTEIHITISAGVTTMQASDHTLFDVVHRADQALLSAKNAGRNQTLSIP